VLLVEPEKQAVVEALDDAEPFQLPEALREQGAGQPR
jgi:hypothetical protein